MQALATWRNGHEFLLEDGRAHSVIVDLPPEEGGTSAGTTPHELSVLALAGSLASTFVLLARKRHLDFTGLTLALEGDPPSATGGGLHGTLRLRTRGERSDVDAVLHAALELCPVARLFRATNISIHVVAAITPLGHTA